MLIFIVIPVFNRWHFTCACLDSLRNQTFPHYKVVVVDHGSTDGTSENIQRDFPEVVLIKGDASMWWSAATNIGVQYALQNGASHVLTLNNDLVVQPTYLQTLADGVLKKPNALIGSVAVDRRDEARIAFAGTKWNAFTARYRPAVNLMTFDFSSTDFIATDLLPGRGTLIPTSAFEKLGLFDAERFPHYAADEDFSLQCKNQGFELWVAPQAVVYSEVEATGLGPVSRHKNLHYWKARFTSMKSPANIKLRWQWARKNAPIPLAYYLMDLARLIYSELKTK